MIVNVIGLMSISQTSCSPGGAGYALALEFASRNMRVFATARSTRTLAVLEEKGIETFQLNVTDAESIEALKNEIAKRTGGKLDILFNNAGTSMSDLFFIHRSSALEHTVNRILDY